MKIAVVGNIAGGKTLLSRRLSTIYKIEVTHIDHIQFVAPMNIRPLDETRKILNEITKKESWIIDGFGPLDLLEKRFRSADHIVFIDLSLWRHLMWCLKRQALIAWRPRLEIPSECDEASFKHTVKLFKTLWRIHFKMRPELMKLLLREGIREKLVCIRGKAQLEKIGRDGI